MHLTGAVKDGKFEIAVERCSGDRLPFHNTIYTGTRSSRL